MWIGKIERRIYLRGQEMTVWARDLFTRCDNFKTFNINYGFQDL